MAAASLVNGAIYMPGGQIPVTEERCCCGWPGKGWYCVISYGYLVEGCTGSANASYTDCIEIVSQDDWDSYLFNVCQPAGLPGESYMNTTDGIIHATEQDCIDAGCVQ
jgi:hypothetical protein